MKAFIPIATGKTVPMSVISSIECQIDVSVDIEIVDAPGLIESQRVYSKERIKGEAASRTKIIEKVMPLDDNEYVFCIDSDIVNLYDSNLILMKNFLDDNYHFGAVALNWLSENIFFSHCHIRLMAVLYRANVLKKLIFNPDNNGCFCLSVKKQILEQGLEFDYLDNIKRVGEIIDGKIN